MRHIPLKVGGGRPSHTDATHDVTLPSPPSLAHRTVVPSRAACHAGRPASPRSPPELAGVGDVGTNREQCRVALQRRRPPGGRSGGGGVTTGGGVGVTWRSGRVCVRETQSVVCVVVKTVKTAVFIVVKL